MNQCIKVSYTKICLFFQENNYNNQTFTYSKPLEALKNWCEICSKLTIKAPE